MTRRRPRPLTFATVLRVGAEHAKAIASGTVAALGVLRADLPHGITGQESIDVAIAFIVGTGIVAGIANRKPRASRQ